MRKLADFLVNKRLWLFIAVILIAVACIVLMQFVNVNEDMTQYLPKDSSMRAGIEIMKNEFPSTAQTETFKLMFENLTAEEKQTVKNKLETFDGVISVEYDIESSDHNSGKYTLYIINTEYSETAKTQALLNKITAELDIDRAVHSYYANSDDSALGFLLPIALTLFLVVLALLCRSYIEVFLMLSSIGFSVLINMGTNIIFPSISDMTLSIAAVLQLVLSIDYSVMLLHRYEQERTLLAGVDNVQAMKNAIGNSFGSISGSAFTTIVGLLVLLFMSFTIGADMGLVMAKGILCSLICVFTVMPALILWCDGLLQKTNKAALREKRKTLRKEKGNA